MKTNHLLIFVFLMLLPSEVLSQTTYIRLLSLPWEAREVITKEFGNWEFFDSAIPYFDSTGTRRAWEYADLIEGDFNDDKRRDFALLVKPYEINAGFLVVLFNKETGFELNILEKISYYKDFVLFLNEKGTIDYDYDKGSQFVLPIDGIELSTYEKGGTTYYWKDGQFIKVATSD